MNRAIKKDILIVLWYVLVSVVMEVIIFNRLGFGAPKYIWFDIAFWLGFGLLLLPLNNILKITICTLLLIVQGIVNSVNASLFLINGDLFYWQMINKVSDGFRAFTKDDVDIMCAIIMIALVIVAVVGFVLIEKYFKVDKVKSKKSKLALGIALIIVSMPVMSLINYATYYNLNKGDYNFSSWQGIALNEGISKNDILNSADELANEQKLYNNLNSSVKSMKTFGSFGFYIKNLGNIINNKTTKENSNALQKTINYINSGSVADVVMGTSEGNNLITILLETGSWFGIDPYLTPNLYALSHTSNDDFIINNDLKFVADNTLKLKNYAARNSTNVSEFSVLLGSCPISNDGYYVMFGGSDISDMDFSFSGANMLKSHDPEMKTSYFHPSTGEIYNRVNSIKYLGFDNVMFLEDMDKLEVENVHDFHNFVLDSDFMANYISKIIDTKNTFYTHINSITTHGSFINKSAEHKEKIKPYTEELLKNWDKVMEYHQKYTPQFTFPTSKGDFYTMYVNYKSAYMDLDKAIGVLFDNLKSSGLLNNTTVVLFSDHYAYYNGLNNYVCGYDRFDIGHTDLYTIPAFIFDTKMASKLTDNGQDLTRLYNYTFSTPWSLLPTVFDLFNIKYNYNMYMGVSVFDERSEYNVMIGSLNGIFNDDFFSFDVFNVENHNLDSRLDFQNKKYKYYCNAVYNYTKMRYVDNIYIYNKQIFKK